MAIFLSGLLGIPVDTIDAARIDGAGYFRRLWYIYIPQIVPSIAIATILCLVGSFGIFDEAVGFGALYGNLNFVVPDGSGNWRKDVGYRKDVGRNRGVDPGIRPAHCTCDFNLPLAKETADGSGVKW